MGLWLPLVGRRRIRLHNIRNRLIANYISISLFVLIVLESLFIFVINQYYIGGIEQTLTSHVETSADFFSRYGDRGDIYAKSNFIFENMDTKENALIEVIDLKGNGVKREMPIKL